MSEREFKLKVCISKHKCIQLGTNFRVQVKELTKVATDTDDTEMNDAYSTSIFTNILTSIKRTHAQKGNSVEFPVRVRFNKVPACIQKI